MDVFSTRSGIHKDLAGSVPESPIVEQQTVDAHPHEHPHPHETLVPETPPANTGVFEPKNIIVENSVSTPPKPEDGTTQVDAAEQTEDVKKNGAAWQTDDAHEHKTTPKSICPRTSRYQ